MLKLKHLISLAGFRYAAMAFGAVAMLAGGVWIASSFGHSAQAQPATHEAVGNPPASFAEPGGGGRAFRSERQDNEARKNAILRHAGD